MNSSVSDRLPFSRTLNPKPIGLFRQILEALEVKPVIGVVGFRGFPLDCGPLGVVERLVTVTYNIGSDFWCFLLPDPT